MSKQNDRIDNALEIAAALQSIPLTSGKATIEHRGYKSTKAVKTLQKTARIIHLLDERACNGYANTDWGRKAEARAEKHQEKLQRQAEAILARK